MIEDQQNCEAPACTRHGGKCFVNYQCKPEPYKCGSLPENYMLDAMRYATKQISKPMENNFERKYRTLVSDILNNGELRNTRTGQTRAVFNKVISHKLDDGFPMLTGRKINLKTIAVEFEWMLWGKSLAWMQQQGVHIWDAWEGKGTIPYGHYIQRQWNAAKNILINEPQSRRAIIEMWQHNDINNYALPPCYHTLQFYISGGCLNLSVAFRSSDVAIGLPHDIPVLALFLKQMSKEINVHAGELTCMLVDAHINEENTGIMYKYLNRNTYMLTELIIAKDKLGLKQWERYSLRDYLFDAQPLPKLIVKP